MSILAWTYLIVGSTFVLYIGIAIWSRVRTTAGFNVAGRGVPALDHKMPFHTFKIPENKTRNYRPTTGPQHTHIQFPHTHIFKSKLCS